jgi:Uma2 family endonuclease
MSEDAKAELVGGIVYMPPPVGPGHGEADIRLGAVLTVYEAATPGVRASHNTTVILGEQSEPQPDIHLRFLPEAGGRVVVNERGMLRGAPELVVEVAHSSESLDLHAKRADYAKAGVLEYLVFLVREGTLRAFDLPGGRELPVARDGIYRSKVFPGLWIDPAAVLSGDLRRVFVVLERGVKSRGHTAFVKRLGSTLGHSKASKSKRPRLR